MAADVDEAIEFMRLSVDAESENRALALVDLNFRYGDQWPAYASASRGQERPQLTINEMDSYIRQVTNSQRQQRPRIKIHPVDDFADVKTAKVITGLMRHFEVNSDADNAYDTAFDFAATMGWGYWRVDHDFIAEDSFNQDIFINSITNPFSVYFDPASKLPDGSDAEKTLITDMMRKSTVLEQYPGANLGEFTETATGDSDPTWMTKDQIRLAEYFFIERKKAKLVMLSNGEPVWADELPAPELLARAGISVTGDRDSMKRIVKWRKQSAYDIFDEKVLPWRWIPVVPVYWTKTRIDNKILCQGMVRPGMDPQRMINFWQTSITESIALAPKAKWLGYEGFDEGHENEFRNANLSSSPTLRASATGVDGQPIPLPTRLQPEPPPSGTIEAAMQANQNLQRVMGIFDPATRAATPKSGIAIQGEQGQSENSNYHGYDNLTRSIKHTARIILSGIPKILDVPTTRRIIGEDGTPDLVKINDAQEGADDQAISKVLNDVRVGAYDVVMDTGPGYDTKRMQGVDAMMQLMQTPIGEKVASVGDDLLVRHMDFPGADVLADRLAAANPMSQVDEASDVPPQVQMQLKQLQAQLQEAQQQIQAQEQVIKSRSDLKQMEENAETQREHMRMVQKAHDTEIWSKEERDQVQSVERTKLHDTTMNNQTKLTVEEIKGHIALLLARLGNEGEAKEQAIDSAI